MLSAARYGGMPHISSNGVCKYVHACGVGGLAYSQDRTDGPAIGSDSQVAGPHVHTPMAVDEVRVSSTAGGHVAAPRDLRRIKV